MFHLLTGAVGLIFFISNKQKKVGPGRFGLLQYLELVWKKNCQVGVICTVCSRSNTQHHSRLSIFACGVIRKSPEMIVECIGNKANGMAELRRLLQK